MIFASNYLKINPDDSTLERIIPIELYRYFNSERTPVDVLGKTLWNNDYSNLDKINDILFLCLCASIYFQNKRKVDKHIPESWLNRIESNIDEGLLEKFDQLPRNEFIPNKKLKELAIDNKATINKVKTELAKYCKTNKLTFKRERTNEHRGVKIITN